MEKFHHFKTKRFGIGTSNVNSSLSIKVSSMKRIVCIIGLVVSAIGCTPVDDDLPRTVVASGVIKLDDKPIEGAAVVIMQDGGAGRFAHGVSDSSGKFSLAAFETKKGAVPGDYKVTVSKTVEVSGKSIPKNLKEDAQSAGGDAASNVSWKNELPDRYNSPVTSGLTITIPETGASDLQILLKSK